MVGDRAAMLFGRCFAQGVAALFCHENPAADVKCGGLIPSRKSMPEDSQNGECLQIGRQFFLVARRTLFDPWIPDKVGHALKSSSYWRRDSTQSAVFRWSPFPMYLGHMGDGESRRQAEGLKAA
jgi:hypothetical protein